MRGPSDAGVQAVGEGLLESGGGDGGGGYGGLAVVEVGGRGSGATPGGGVGPAVGRPAV